MAIVWKLEVKCKIMHLTLLGKETAVYKYNEPIKMRLKLKALAEKHIAKSQELRI